MSRYDEVWRRVRLELAMLAEGGTTSFDKHVNSGKPGAKRPPPAGHELRDFDFRWICADSDGARKRIIQDALGYLQDHRLRKLNTHTAEEGIKRGTRPWKQEIGKAAELYPLRYVAKQYRVSHTTVANYRDGKFN